VAKPRQDVLFGSATLLTGDLYNAPLANQGLAPTATKFWFGNLVHG